MTDADPCPASASLFADVLLQPPLHRQARRPQDLSLAYWLSGSLAGALVACAAGVFMSCVLSSDVPHDSRRCAGTDLVLLWGRHFPPF